MAGVKAGTAYIDVQGDFSALNKQIDAAVAPITGKFGKLGKAGAVGLAGVGAAAVVAGKALYDIGGQFDDAYDTIRVGTGKTGKALKGLEGDFKAVVKSVPTDFDSASSAISQLNSRLGITGKPLRNLSSQVLELSRITKTDLSGNIESVTRVFGDWGISTKNQAGALNKLFRASQATNVPVAKLSDLMVKFGGPLRQLGFGFDQAAALAGKFQKEGVNTELVMGSLRIALGKMAKQGVKDPQEALQKLTEQIKNAGSAGEANKLALETFGARAGPDMAAAIREGRFEIGDLQKTIAGGKDTIMGASKDTQDFSEKWQLFKNRVMVGLEPLATRVFGAVGTAMDALPGIVDTVRGAFDRFKASLGGGGQGGFASQAASSFNQLKDAVVTTFQTIVLVGGFLWDKFGATLVDHLKDTVKMIAGVLQGVITAFKGITDIISGILTGDWGKAWTGVKEVFSGVWTAVVAIVEGAWENVKTIVSLGITAIGTIVKAAAGALLALGKWIVEKIAAGIKAYAQLWVDAAGWIKNRLVEGIKGLAGAFLDAGKWVTNRLGEGVKTVTAALSDVGGWIKNRIVEFVQREASGLVNIGTWIVNRVAEGVKTLTEGLSTVGGWLKNRLLDGVEAVKDGFTSIGGSMIGWIVAGLKAGANKLVGFLNTIIGLVNKLPGVDIGKIAALAQGGSFSTAGVEAFATGGEVRRGTKLTRPMIMMGEEAPRHPEYVIPTNPAYRKRAVGLYQQLGSELGISGYALGGVIGDAVKTVGKVATGILPTGLLAKGASWLLDRLPKPEDMLPRWMVGLGKHVVHKVGDWIKDKVTGILGSSGGVEGAGGGVGTFDGKPVASWIIPILKAARASGVAFNVSSGFRSFAEQTRLWNQLGRDPAIVARPGTSNHEGSAYPRGAVDISPGWQALSAWLAQRNLPLHHYGNPRDPYHFSATGHAKGGIIQGPFVGSYRNGGVIPRDGLAYVHQGETVTPAGGIGEVRIFVGDREIKDIVRVEVDESRRQSGATYRAGALA